MVLLASLRCGAFAAAGTLRAGTGGVVVMDKAVLAPGQSYKAETGNIPGYVVYEGASGKAHHYVPMEMIAAYLDIPVSWSEARNSVVLGPTSEGTKYETLTGWNRYVKAPVLGAKAGPFTEIDPAAVDVSKGPTGIFEDESVAETCTGFGTRQRMSTIGGKHLILTITNNGDVPAVSLAGRAFMINGYEWLSKVTIDPGQTLTRAFEIDEDVDRIHNEFVSCVGPETTERIHVTVSLKRYP